MLLIFMIMPLRCKRGKGEKKFVPIDSEIVSL